LLRSTSIPSGYRGTATLRSTLSGTFRTDVPHGAVDALEIAVAARRPAKGTIHHSDHGGPYIGLTFGQTCHDAGIAQSMGAVGSCF